MKTTINGITYDSTKSRYIDGYTVTRSRSEARATEVFGLTEQANQGITLTINISPEAAAQLAAAIVSALPTLDIAPLRSALDELIG